jgi:hypothetical protein
LLFIFFLALPSALAMDATDIAADAPQDALMAGPAENQEMQDWASATFTGRYQPGSESAASANRRGLGTKGVGTSVPALDLIRLCTVFEASRY